MFLNTTCLFDWSDFVFLFDLGLMSLSTIFQSYHNGVWMWQGAQCSLLERCLTGISRPRHFDMIFHPVTLYCHWADQFKLYFLNTERQAKEQLVPFLKSLVWQGQGSNPQPPGHRGNALPLSHCASLVWLDLKFYTPINTVSSLIWNHEK